MSQASERFAVPQVLYAPIRNERGVPGMQSCVIAVAGYKGPIRDDIRELVEAAGAVFHQSFTKKTTHLICYRAESEIYAKALLFKVLLLLPFPPFIPASWDCSYLGAVWH